MWRAIWCHPHILTAQQVDGCVTDGEGDGLGAGDSGAAAGHILGSDAEKAAGFLGQHVLTVAQKREAAPIKRHVVRVARGDAGASAQRLPAVPASRLAHT